MFKESGLDKIIKPDGRLERWEGSFDFVSNDKLKEKIVEIVSDEKNYIDKGGAGTVFDLGAYCIKLMKNRHNKKDMGYDLGNSPYQEYKIQNLLRGLTIDGVFVPEIYGVGIGEESSAIVMGRLDAVNMQKVLNGEEKLPDNFSLEDFFADLEGYMIDGVHERGIIHNDLKPRNIMICRQTGKPRVIDFGRSLYFEEKPDNFRALLKHDLDDVENAYQEMEQYLKTLK